MGSVKSMLYCRFGTAKRLENFKIINKTTCLLPCYGVWRCQTYEN
jgi:hypothetical protein